MSFFDDSSSGFPGFGGDGGFFGSSSAPFGSSSLPPRSGEQRAKPEGRKSGASWSGADNSGFWSEDGATFTSPAPSQTQGASAHQRRSGVGSSGTNTLAGGGGGGGGLIYANIGMLLRAADEAWGSRRSRSNQNSSNSAEAEGPQDANTGGLKLQLHGQEITTVGLRGWVSAAGAQHLPSAVRFVLCDGTGEIEVEVGLVEGRPWWGDGHSKRASAGRDEGGASSASAAALWNFQRNSSSKSLDGKKTKSQEKDRDEEERGDEGQESEDPDQRDMPQDKTRTPDSDASNTKNFLDPGSLVRVIGAPLLLADDGRRKSKKANHSTSSNTGGSDDEETTGAENPSDTRETPRVYLEAITCAPIKDAREFSVLHPVEVAFAAATFLSRSGRLQQPAAVLDASGAAKKKARLLQEKSERTGDEEEDQTKKLANPKGEKDAIKEEHLKVLKQEYGYIEDLVQQKVLLFLLQQGDSEKRVSKQRLLTHLCSEAVAGENYSAEQVEKALQELEESGETIEHAGIVALAC